MKLHEIATMSIDAKFLARLQEKLTEYTTHVERSGRAVYVWGKLSTSDHWQGYIHAELTPYKQPDGSYITQLNVVEVFVEPSMRKRGLGSTLYDTVEQVMGQRVQPSGELSDDAVAFWIRRDPTLSSDDLEDYVYGSFDDYDSDFTIPSPK